MKKISSIKHTIILIIVSIFLFGCTQNMNHNDNLNNNLENHSTNNLDEEENLTENQDELDQTQSFILEIYDLAKQGRLYGTNWEVGEVRASDIEEMWGKANSIDEAAGGFYATYSDKNIVFGMDERGKIYDLRTYADDIKQITEGETIATLGEADELRFFNEEHILVYGINDYYELKFIFPPAEGDEDERYLSHINLVYLPWSPATVGNFPIVEDVTEIITNMTLAEKIGQLIITGIDGKKVDEEIKDFIQNKHVGGVILLGRNIENVRQIETLIKDVKKLNRSHIPLFIGVDEEGGRITRLPEEVVPTPAKGEIGLVNNPEIAFELGKLIGEKISAFGINMNFSPVLDIDSNPLNPVIGDRSYGSEMKLVKDFGVKEMKGLKESGVIPVAKHFPGHGDTELDSHIDLPILTHTLDRLYSFELQPFIHAINNGADAIMVGHLLVPAFDDKFPASMSQILIDELLRKELGFNGVVITDDMTMGAIMDNYSIEEAAVQSILAGVDIILINHEYENTAKVIDAIEAAVSSGKITVEQIDQRVERIISLKKDYFLADKILPPVDVTNLNKKTESFLKKWNQP